MHNFYLFSIPPYPFPDSNKTNKTPPHSIPQYLTSLFPHSPSQTADTCNHTTRTEVQDESQAEVCASLCHIKRVFCKGSTANPHQCYS